MTTELTTQKFLEIVKEMNEMSLASQLEEGCTVILLAKYFPLTDSVKIGEAVFNVKGMNETQFRNLMTTELPMFD